MTPHLQQHGAEVQQRPIPRQAQGLAGCQQLGGVLALALQGGGVGGRQRLQHGPGDKVLRLPRLPRRAACLQGCRAGRAAAVDGVGLGAWHKQATRAGLVQGTPSGQG
jgi:hypothetical protein